MAKTYELKPTDDKDLFRVVDREGDWTHYYHQPSKTYLRAVNFILESGYAKGARFYQYLKSKSADEADRILKAAGERSDRVHQAIRIILDTGKIDRSLKVLGEDNATLISLSNDEWDCLLAFGEFWNRHECVLISGEKSVYTLSFGYAGTLDAIVRMTKECGVRYCPCKEYVGRLGLYDWKSSGGIYSNYGAQVAAYGAAFNATATEKLDYTAILRIGTNHKSTGGYEFEPYNSEETNRHWKEFLAAKQIGDAEYKPFTDAEIVEIPEVIELKKAVPPEEPKPEKVRKPRIKKRARPRARAQRPPKINQCDNGLQ